MQFSLVAVQVIYVHWGYLLYRRFAPYSRYHHVKSYQHTNIQPYSHITQHLAAFQIVESFNFFCCTYRQVLNLPTKKITEDVREKKCDSIKELSLAEDGHVTSCQQLSLSSCYELKKRSQKWKWTYWEKKRVWRSGMIAQSSGSLPSAGLGFKHHNNKDMTFTDHFCQLWATFKWMKMVHLNPWCRWFNLESLSLKIVPKDDSFGLRIVGCKW